MGANGSKTGSKSLKHNIDSKDSNINKSLGQIETLDSNDNRGSNQNDNDIDTNSCNVNCNTSIELKSELSLTAYPEKVQLQSQCSEIFNFRTDSDLSDPNFVEADHLHLDLPVFTWDQIKNTSITTKSQSLSESQSIIDNSDTISPNGPLRYTVILGGVYDISNFRHPGGPYRIRTFVAGQDATEAFMRQHGNTYRYNLSRVKLVGRIEGWKGAVGWDKGGYYNDQVSGASKFNDVDGPQPGPEADASNELVNKRLSVTNKSDSNTSDSSFEMNNNFRNSRLNSGSISNGSSTVTQTSRRTSIMELGSRFLEKIDNLTA